MNKNCMLLASLLIISNQVWAMEIDQSEEQAPLIPTFTFKDDPNFGSPEVFDLSNLKPGETVVYIGPSADNITLVQIQKEGVSPYVDPQFAILGQDEEGKEHFIKLTEYRLKQGKTTKTATLRLPHVKFISSKWQIVGCIGHIASAPILVLAAFGGYKGVLEIMEWRKQKLATKQAEISPEA